MATARRRAAQVVEVDPAGEELLLVDVPKAFNLLDHQSVMHKFEAGEQNMRRKYAEHSYAKANGVKVL